MEIKKNPKVSIILIALAFLAYFLHWSYGKSAELTAVYRSNESSITIDRHARIVSVTKNARGYYAIHENKLPEKIKSSLIKKEDRFFYFHPGINPVSLAREAIHGLRNEKSAASTINQQLAKIILANEGKRSLRNKLEEMVSAIALEMWTDKDDILLMYANSAYLGNGVQGIGTASQLYYGKAAEALSDEEIASLLATIPSPTAANPFEPANKEAAKRAAALIGLAFSDEAYPIPDSKERKRNFQAIVQHQDYFELPSLYALPATVSAPVELAVDLDLTDKLRSLAKRHTERFFNKNGSNAAIVVIKPQTNELLAIVGSPDPSIDDYGYLINMAIKPRPIGSTVKPFIYLKAFEKGARPYTLVEDKEYKYGVKGDFAFYPKNYDFEYRGLVDLEYALGNSLNVPTVKTLEYAGLEKFYGFLEKDLALKPAQDLKNYELGIALGGLEMDLLSLCYYYSILPNEGRLRPLIIADGLPALSENLSAELTVDKQVIKKGYIELINKTLSNRLLGAEEFGQKSSLNLPHDNYAVKTGTSRDYHDSWTIGYTPDFLVGVWLGNAENKPMDEVSGSVGAGQIWHEAMNLLYASEYNHNTPFDFSDIKRYEDGASIEYGLDGDDYAKIKNIMLGNDLILSPHDGDTFLFEKGMAISLSAREAVDWQIDGAKIGNGEKMLWEPKKTGSFSIEAKNGSKQETTTVRITD